MDLAIIAGPGDLHFSLNGLNVDQFSCDVKLFDLPHSACKRKSVADGRGRCDGSDLFGFVTDREILAILKYGVKLKARDQSLAGKTDYEPFFFRHLDIIIFDHRDHQRFVILFADARKRGQRKNSLRKCSRCKLSA